ncbi:alpha/beta fold hydrolase [Occultella aeris]|uniref:2-hydroxymuconate semialdehyde hydrolase n=1 Tax=Occultella aeris TaxID=2761496 RepID=A0A7M4DRX9_9MICO|nr:alpha/beta hydrolase [Occultella aeris]VZO40223.1 2-hydroxymuconate semialdehyde hydrolase [Occultella aeris]
MEPSRSIIDLPWGPVSYLHWSPAAKASSSPSVVVLLHGGNADSASLSWGELGSHLAAAGHRVVAPDHPGFGESPRAPWTATQDRLVAYVGELVDALGLEYYVIGGLSLGGGLTIGHVLARPERVTGAMLFGSYGLQDRLTGGWLSLPTQTLTWLALRTGLLGLAQEAYARSPRLLASGMRQIVRSPDRLTEDLLAEITVAAGRKGARVAFEQWQRDQVLWNRTRTNYQDRLHDVAAPTLVVHGSQDSGVPVARAREAAARIPDAHLLVVDGAGHWVQRDRPDLVTPAVVRFLDTRGELDGGDDAAPAHP